MNGTTGQRPRGRALAVALLAAALGLLGVAACAKKVLTVDPEYTSPEGELTAEARMVVWREGEVEVEIWGDAAPIGPSIDEFCGVPRPGLTDDDSLMLATLHRRGSPNTIVGMILERTPATRYEILRRESNGGLRQLHDFVIPPVRRWLQSQWEVYRFTDPNPSGFDPPTYQGRGVVAGTVTGNAPVTNAAVAQVPAIGNITYTGLCNPPDSLFTLRWSAVPGAFRYWIHVYRFAQAPSADELLNAGLPGPVAELLTSDILLACIDTTLDAGGAAVPPGTTYRLGDHSRRDVTILSERSPGFTEHFVRITAVDSLGQILAYNRGDYGVLPGETGTYRLYRRGASVVTPRRPVFSAERAPAATVPGRTRRGG